MNYKLLFIFKAMANEDTLLEKHPEQTRGKQNIFHAAQTWYRLLWTRNVPKKTKRYFFGHKFAVFHVCHPLRQTGKHLCPATLGSVSFAMAFRMRYSIFPCPEVVKI